MRPHERRQAIESNLGVQGRVSVVDLAQQRGVAQETMRRDLTKLETNGLIFKLHGGAVTTQSKFEQSFAARIEQNIP